MRQLGLLFTVMALAVSALINVPIRAQEDDLEATLAALQTQVAEVETAIAERDGTPSPSGSGASPPFGNATFPPGDHGTLSIVAVGPYGYGSPKQLPVVIRNNTGSAVASISVTGIARAADSSLLAAGGDQGVLPNLVEAGGLAFGYVQFDDVDLPPDASFDLEVDGEAPSEGFGGRDLRIDEVEIVDDRFVGILTNNTDVMLTGPISIDVLCVDATGIPSGVLAAYLEKDELDPGESAGFQVQIYAGQVCATFLVASNGWSI